MNNKSIGIIGEQAVIFSFTQIGVQVFTPIGDNSPVDLIVDFNRKLNKIQIKTSINSGEKSYFCHLTKNFFHVQHNGRELYTKQEIDFFALYNLERKIPVLIPFNEVENLKGVTIRFDEKGNNGKKFFKEEDYLFEKITRQSFSYKELPKKGNNKNYCIDCGKLINIGSLRCQKCDIKNRELAFDKKLKKKVSREDLKRKIRLYSFESIGREFNVSGNTVRKWCKRYNLPFKKEIINNFSQEEWEQV